MIKDGRVILIGPIRQEILSGIANTSKFKQLKNALSAFEDIQLTTEHFVKAAEFSNLCRAKGIQGSTIDLLICAAAYIEDLMIFTIDTDFTNYQKHLPIKLLTLD